MGSYEGKTDYKTHWQSFRQSTSYEAEAGKSGGVINTLGSKGTVTRSPCIVGSVCYFDLPLQPFSVIPYMRI